MMLQLDEVYLMRLNGFELGRDWDTVLIHIMKVCEPPMGTLYARIRERDESDIFW